VRAGVWGSLTPSSARFRALLSPAPSCDRRPRPTPAKPRPTPLPPPARRPGNAGTWFDTAALVTNVRNFPNSRGYVVGILKSFLGLSASVYTTIYVAAFAPDAVTFLLVLG
jgi:hypothetical protein